MPFDAKDCAEVRNLLRGKCLGHSYGDMVRWLKRAGCDPPRNPSGSHRVWVHPSGRRLPLKDAGNRHLLPAYVKDTLKALLEAERCPN